MGAGSERLYLDRPPTVTGWARGQYRSRAELKVAGWTNQAITQLGRPDGRGHSGGGSCNTHLWHISKIAGPAPAGR